MENAEAVAESSEWKYLHMCSLILPYLKFPVFTVFDVSHGTEYLGEFLLVLVLIFRQVFFSAQINSIC